MNRGFNLKYDQMKQNDPTNNPQTGDDSDQSIILYDPDEQVRNICFVIDTTRRMFLNYSYLISGEYLPEENKIILTFTTYNIVIIGVNLVPFYNHLMDNKVRMVLAVDSRYNDLVDNKPVVNKIDTKANPN